MYVFLSLYLQGEGTERVSLHLCESSESVLKEDGPREKKSQSYFLSEQTCNLGRIWFVLMISMWSHPVRGPEERQIIRSHVPVFLQVNIQIHGSTSMLTSLCRKIKVFGPGRGLVVCGWISESTSPSCGQVTEGRIQGVCDCNNCLAFVAL